MDAEHTASFYLRYPVRVGATGLPAISVTERNLGRNLFILAATLATLALVSCGLSYTNIAQQPGSPGDASLWRTMGLCLFLLALLVALGGIFTALFEQAERRADEERRRNRQH